MTVLFPRLSLEHCQLIAQSWSSREARPIVRHEQQTYAPIGGSRVSDDALEDLRCRVRAASVQVYASGDESSADAQVSRVLREQINITCHEAAQGEVWQFVACALLPDVLIWRFGDQNGSVNERRWHGDLRRNAFARLWWRAETLGTTEAGSVDVSLLAQLREDEIVQIMERPSLAGNPVLARCIATGFLDAIRVPSEAIKRVRDSANGRQLIMRELTKRLLRLGCIRPFEALDDSQLKSVVCEQLEVTCESLLRSWTGPETRMAA